MAGAKKTSVSIMDLDEQIVNELAERHGLNFSAALRFIIREWKVRNDAPYTVTEKGKQALEELESK